jgi:hypothetical protein
MGNTETKPDFKKAVIELTSQVSKLDDNVFWDQFWATTNVQSVKDVFNIISASDLRDLKQNSPSNLSTICYKAIECLRKSRDASCPPSDHKKVYFHLKYILQNLGLKLHSSADSHHSVYV